MKQRIILQAHKQTSFLQKSIGLLNKKPHSIFFETRFGIHTFGMQYPIDVIILDKKYQVKKMRKNLQPNRIFLWNPFYKGVLEMPAGDIAKHNIHEGSELTVEM